MNESDPILYEFYYMFKAQSPDDAASRVSALTGSIEKEHGIIASQTQPAIKTLAYPVKKEREAYTCWIRCMLKPDAAARLLDHFRAEPSLLRFLWTRTRKDERALEAPRRRRRTAPPPAPETQAQIAEIDKKLEEILGS